MSKKYPKSFKGQNLSIQSLKVAITRILRKKNGASYTPGKLIKELKISNSVVEVKAALDKLLSERRVVETASGVFQSNDRSSIPTKYVIGKVDMTRSGAAYILVENRDDDIYVRSTELLGAMEGDTVEVALVRRPGRRKVEGKVVRIVRRGRDVYMGKIFVNKKYSVVSPFKAPLGFEIFVFADDLNEAEDGDIVTVKITSWPTPKNKMIKGEVLEVISTDNPADMEMKSILIGQGFDLHFNKETLEEAERLPTAISDQEVALRKDLREVTTFTIDPFNAKDFDDALSYRQLDDGEVEVGVHIADVSHYVRPGSALDSEAYQRSTSVYLVDRVLPMLPEKISNELCSLRPNEDKLTFSALYIYDKDKKLKSQWFGKTVIHSNRRFTYEEAQEIIEKGEGDYVQELMWMNEMAKKMREKRYADGAISFESDEVQFRLDENGIPIEVFVKERKDAHLLVEDFMLLANRTVAEYIRKKSVGGEIPFVYRVHDLPNEEKLNDFAAFAAEFGFKMDLSSPKGVINSLNKLAKESEENETLKLLTPLAIRTMSKAEYTTNNIGHYGLGFKDYTHFTSPIRRYSDILSHRILFDQLENKGIKEDKSKLEIKCKHISAQERKAMEAERESVKYKQVEFISRFVGQEFDGIIVGMHDRGIFVELVDNHCEGMIRFDRFDEPFILEESKLKAIGRISGHLLKIGDSIRIRILDADLDKRQIDMDIVEGREKP